MRNLSHENDFDLNEIEIACRTHFHMKGFALRLVLKKRQRELENGLLFNRSTILNQSARIFFELFSKLFSCYLTDIPASQLSNHCFSSLGSDDEPVTQNHCNCISPLVGGKWKNVLRNLGVEEVPTIQNVDKNHSNETVEEKCYQGLLVWMANCGTQTATTKKLCDALRQTGCTKALETLSKAGMSNHD